jgi:hypothetical protein
VSAQLSVNWSDESYRKMSTKISLWGTRGRIYADRQEVQVFLRDDAALPAGYRAGWNVRYTTELTNPVWFYLRGEEYSAQIDYFVQQIAALAPGAAPGDNVNGFVSAAQTDRVIGMMLADDAAGPREGQIALSAAEIAASEPKRRFSIMGALRGR